VNAMGSGNKFEESDFFKGILLIIILVHPKRMIFPIQVANSVHRPIDSIACPAICQIMPKSEASLDLSSSSSEASYDSDEDFRLAQREWDDSLEQLQQLVSVVLLPFIGKWLGRRWSQWAFARYLRLGLGKSFFLGTREL